MCQRKYFLDAIPAYARSSLSTSPFWPIPAELLCHTQRRFLWGILQSLMSSFHSSQCFAPAACFCGKEKSCNSPVVGSELAGPFELLSLVSVGQQHKHPCPQGVPVPAGTRELHARSSAIHQALQLGPGPAKHLSTCLPLSF